LPGEVWLSGAALKRVVVVFFLLFLVLGQDAAWPFCNFYRVVCPAYTGLFAIPPPINIRQGGSLAPPQVIPGVLPVHLGILSLIYESIRSFWLGRAIVIRYFYCGRPQCKIMSITASKTPPAFLPGLASRWCFSARFRVFEGIPFVSGAQFSFSSGDLQKAWFVINK